MNYSDSFVGRVIFHMAMRKSLNKLSKGGGEGSGSGSPEMNTSSSRSPCAWTPFTKSTSIMS
eukprot:m.343919 g.343919  ORF g.343919 m.343919 type:complete len:62 (-) comp20638_c0_seq2:981-1166(-)